MSRLLDIHRFRRERRPVQRHVPTFNQSSIAEARCTLCYGTFPDDSPLAHEYTSRPNMGIFYRVEVTFADGSPMATYYVVPVSSGSSVSYVNGSRAGSVYNVNERTFRAVCVTDVENGPTLLKFDFFDIKKNGEFSVTLPLRP